MKTIIGFDGSEVFFQTAFESTLLPLSYVLNQIWVRADIAVCIRPIRRQLQGHTRGILLIRYNREKLGFQLIDRNSERISMDHTILVFQTPAGKRN